MRPTNWTVTPVYSDSQSCAIIDDSTEASLWLSQVPKHIKQLEIEWRGPLFKAEAIANVTHLFVQHLYPGCTYPPTLENLFIRDYNGEPVPDVTNLFFHFCDLTMIEKVDVGEHYLWYIDGTTNSQLNTTKYRIAGKRVTMDVCGRKYEVIKRVPKVDPKVIQGQLRAINEQIGLLHKEAEELLQQAHDQTKE